MKNLLLSAVIIVTAGAASAAGTPIKDTSPLSPNYVGDPVWTFWGSHKVYKGNGSVAMPGLTRKVCLSFLDLTNKMDFEDQAVGVGCFNTETGEVISPALQ